MMTQEAFQDRIPNNFCYGCGPTNERGLRIKSYWDGDEAVCTFQPQLHHAAGPRQFLNGGIIATVIDCHSICTAIAHTYKLEEREIGSDPDIWCVTGSLNMTYLRPTPIDQPVLLRARIRETSGRKTIVACTLSSGGEERVQAEVVAVRVSSSWRGSPESGFHSSVS